MSATSRAIAHPYRSGYAGILDYRKASDGFRKGVLGVSKRIGNHCNRAEGYLKNRCSLAQRNGAGQVGEMLCRLCGGQAVRHQVHRSAVGQGDEVWCRHAAVRQILRCPPACSGQISQIFLINFIPCSEMCFGAAAVKCIARLLRSKSADGFGQFVELRVRLQTDIPPNPLPPAAGFV